MTPRRLLSVAIIGLGLGFISVIFSHLQNQGQFRWRWQASTASSEGSVSLAATSFPGSLFESPSPTPTAKPVMTITEPQHLIVAPLGIAASVEKVGLDPQGRMGVPSNDLNVGWFKLGVPIGEVGSAVIAGHYDARNGGPAVFYNLNDLKSGDEILIRGSNGENLTFVVEEVAQYKDNTFPLDRVFGASSERRLNLITCAGTYSRSQQNYSDRLVVYTVLKNTHELPI